MRIRCADAIFAISSGNTVVGPWHNRTIRRSHFQPPLRQGGDKLEAFLTRIAWERRPHSPPIRLTAYELAARFRK